MMIGLQQNLNSRSPVGSDHNNTETELRIGDLNSRSPVGSDAIGGIGAAVALGI